MELEGNIELMGLGLKEIPIPRDLELRLRDAHLTYERLSIEALAGETSPTEVDLAYWELRTLRGTNQGKETYPKVVAEIIKEREIV